MMIVRFSEKSSCLIGRDLAEYHLAKYLSHKLFVYNSDDDYETPEIILDFEGVEFVNRAFINVILCEIKDCYDTRDIDIFDEIKFINVNDSHQKRLLMMERDRLKKVYKDFIEGRRGKED